MAELRAAPDLVVRLIQPSGQSPLPTQLTYWMTLIRPFIRNKRRGD